jgi:hypothetical protein
MAVMSSKTYDALVAADAPEDKARAAAEELAGYENFTRIGTDLAVLKADMTPLKWMAGVNLAATVPILVKILV